MNSLSVFEFESNQIRVVLVDNEPWFVAKDLCLVLELGNVSQSMSRLDEEEKNTIILNDGTPGNPNTTIVSESGMYSLVLGSRKSEAKAFRKWVTSEVLPSIRKNGAYSFKPKTQAEILVESAQMLLEIERRQQRQESELALVKSDVQEIQQRAIAAEKELKALPAPEQPAQSRTARSNVNSLIRGYCHRCAISHTEAYKNLYREFRDRYHIDLRIRAANGKSAPLDIAESLEVMEDLYALASELFGGENG